MILDDKYVNKIYHGNALEVLKKFPPECLDSVITSPPYWQLRHYQGIPDYIWGGNENCSHKWDENYQPPKGGYSSDALGAAKVYGIVRDKNGITTNYCSKCNAWKGQLGLEPTYNEFIDHLIMIMNEIYRILKPTGTVWINLGDSYSTQSGTNTALSKGKEWDNSSTYITNRGSSGKIQKGDLPSKCLLLIPHRFAMRCIDNGWILRNDIIWAKRNGMPESVTDRFSKKHEFFFFMVKNQKYYFDLDGIKDKLKTSTLQRMQYDRFRDGSKITSGEYSMSSTKKDYTNDINGKNPGDVSDFWDIPTKSSKEKHYATFNIDLISKPIIAGTPEFVCSNCGFNREKIFDIIQKSKGDDASIRAELMGHTASGPTARSNVVGSIKRLIGYTECECNAAYKGGIILDPFAGTGTTLVRALQLGRRCIGIEGSNEYIEIARKNINNELMQGKLF